MTTETIQKNLLERFSLPLRDCYERRIIFWHDPERQFEDIIDALELPGVKLLKLTGSNFFAAKRLLEHDDTASSYLVYDPVDHHGVQNNWLHDIELYSETFSADRISMYMDELRIPEATRLRRAVSANVKFMGSQERMAKLKAFGTQYKSADQIYCDVFAVLADTKDNTPRGILKSLLLGYMKGDNTALEAIAKFSSESDLKELLIRYVGFSCDDDLEVGELAAHVIVSAAASELGDDGFFGLDKYVSPTRCGSCNSFVCDWVHSSDSEQLFQLINDVQDRLLLRQKLSRMAPEQLERLELLPIYDELILERLLEGISTHSISYDDVTAIVDKRRLCGWAGRYTDYYDAAYCAAMQDKLWHEYTDKLHISDYKALWQLYADQLYMIDTYYRKFCLALERAIKHPVDDLDDAVKNAAARVERQYRDEYLSELGQKWTDVISDEVPHDMRLIGVSQQCDFYSNKVSPIVSGGSRAYVIISDALRYEVAAELTKRLIAETNGTANISAMQSIFPSATKYGMAALLPHSRLELNENRVMLSDGIDTSTTADRNRILKNHGKNNVAIKYTDLAAMKRDERRALVNGADTVYIYHNVIDATGEELPTEQKVFEACETAIEDIKSLVKMITGTLSGANILITSDHGFLYTREPLGEEDKLGKSNVSGEICELGRRYAVADERSSAENMLPVSLSLYSSKLKGYAPLEAIRLKLQGGGVNYVHGGISLQEIAVPVIEFKNFRTDSKNFVDTKKVRLQLLSKNRRITNSIFSLDFYQVDPVEGKTVAALFEIYICDKNGRVLSDVQTISADRDTRVSSERVYRKRFVMNGESYDESEIYYLNIIDKENGSLISQDEFKISIAFADEFDF